MGKYKKFLFFFTLIISILFIPNVKAEIISLNSDNSAFGVHWNNYYSYPDYFTINPQSSRNFTLSLYNYEGVTRPYTYLVMSMCSNYSPANWEVINSSYNESFFVDGPITWYLVSDQPCNIALTDGKTGYRYYLQFEVGKYFDYDGTGEELEVVSTIKGRNSDIYGGWYGINTWYLSSDDLVSELKENQLLRNQMLEIENGLIDVQNGINNVNNTLNATNSRLDGINSSINQSNSLLQESNQKQQDMINKQNETNQKLDANTDAVNEQTNTLKDSNSSDATNSAGSFFSGFTTDTFGLTSIITAPLNLITSITSSTCSPVGLPIPFVDNMTLNLPCLRGIYEQHFGTLLSVYQTITFGIVAYWVCIRIFALVKDFKNPEHDEIEVLDL